MDRSTYSWPPLPDAAPTLCKSEIIPSAGSSESSMGSTSSVSSSSPSGATTPTSPEGRASLDASITKALEALSLPHVFGTYAVVVDTFDHAAHEGLAMFYVLHITLRSSLRWLLVTKRSNLAAVN